MNPTLVEVTCAAIFSGRRLLWARRGDSGLWELPGGKRESGESLPACLRREIAEELGVAVEVGELLGVEEELHHGRRLRLYCFRCRLVDGSPQAREHRELVWLTPRQALALPLSPPDRRLALRLCREPGVSSPPPGLDKANRGW